MELIQKKIQKKIKELKNDNKFLESFETNEIKINNTLLQKEEEKGRNITNENVYKNNKISLSAKNFFYKNKNFKNLNNKKEKKDEKIYNQSSQQKLSDDSSFLEDSEIDKNNNNKKHIKNKINDLIKEKIRISIY